MRQDRYQIARNSIIHAGLLVNIANQALGGDTRAMRQDRYQIARNSIIHAGLLVNTANRALGDEAPNSEQDNELTADVYKLARGCEALNDTLAAADNLRKGLGTPY